MITEVLAKQLVKCFRLLPYQPLQAQEVNAKVLQLFSTATGIIGAVVTLMGLLAWPAMVKAGYDKKFASGIICAGGCLGILIPPSIMPILLLLLNLCQPLFYQRLRY